MMQADENLSVSTFDEPMARPFLDEPAQKTWSIPKPSSWFRSTSPATNNLETVSFFSPQKDDEYDHLETSRLLQQGMPCRDLFSNDRSHRPFDTTDDDYFSGCNSYSKSWLPNETEIFASPPKLASTFIHPLSNDNTPTRVVDVEHLPLVSGQQEQMESPIMDAIRRAENDFTKTKRSTPSIVTPPTPKNPRRNVPRVTEDMVPLVLNDTFSDLEGGDSISSAQEEPAQRLSWESIEAFDIAVSNSGIERQLEVLRSKKERKSKLYTLIASAAVVMAVGYFVAGFFWKDGSEIPSGGSPSLIIPFSP